MFLLFEYDDLNALTEDKGLLHVTCHMSCTTLAPKHQSTTLYQDSNTALHISAECLQFRPKCYNLPNSHPALFCVFDA